MLVSLGLGAATAPPITGDYIEVRSHHVYTCGCLYSGEQATGGREAILTWVIQKGEFQGVPLAGLKAVAVVLGQANLGLDETLRKSVVFVDGADSERQRQALVNLLKLNYAAALGEVAAVHDAPISIERNGERVTVKAGELTRVVVRPAKLPEDAHLGSRLWYDPFIPTTESTLATAEYNRFSGEDFQHRWWIGEPGITGYIGTFAIGQ